MQTFSWQKKNNEPFPYPELHGTLRRAGGTGFSSHRLTVRIEPVEVTKHIFMIRPFAFLSAHHFSKSAKKYQVDDAVTGQRLSGLKKTNGCSGAKHEWWAKRTAGGMRRSALVLFRPGRGSVGGRAAEERRNRAEDRSACPLRVTRRPFLLFPLREKLPPRSFAPQGHVLTHTWSAR